MGPPAIPTSFRPEDELEHLTKKMLYDMENPPADEYFGTVRQGEMHLISMRVNADIDTDITKSGRCARCGENVVGEGTGCTAMDQVFHVDCFTCIICNNKLRGQPFYAVEKKAYCEPCYIMLHGLSLLKTEIFIEKRKAVHKSLPVKVDDRTMVRKDLDRRYAITYRRELYSYDIS
ncbi:Lipoma-preferred partner [Tupaia chinensis]|uniref:Lipoma-preferred partner n=1 Tax=Tupaia chinensis TaxID=246437 RepID=L9JP12_TUPCH|nr:Lipoma-preferred partner [Tupaia chinensis]